MKTSLKMLCVLTSLFTTVTIAQDQFLLEGGISLEVDCPKDLHESDTCYFTVFREEGSVAQLNIKKGQHQVIDRLKRQDTICKSRDSQPDPTNCKKVKLIDWKGQW